MKNLLVLAFISWVFFSSCKEQSTSIEPVTQSKWEKVADLPGYYKYVKTKSSSIYMVCYNEGYKFASSQDSGKTWQVNELGFLPNYENGFLSVEGSTFFISGYDGLYKSTDNGLTWNQDIALRSYINPVFSIPCLFDISVNGDTILLGQLITNGMSGYVKGVIISLDGGLNWYCPDALNTPVRAVAVEKLGPIVLCSNNGVKYYDFRFNTWENSTGFSLWDSEINDFVKIGSRVFGVGPNYIKYSDVSGCNWQDIKLKMENNEIIIPLTYTFNHSKLYFLSTKKKIYSINYSNLSWQVLDVELPEFDPFPYENQTLFALGNDYLYYISNDKLWRKKITD